MPDAKSFTPYGAIVARFTEHFVHPANELCKSFRFYTRVQQPDANIAIPVKQSCASLSSAATSRKRNFENGWVVTGFS